jgi:hemoglobin
MLEEIGGEPGCRALSENFYAHIAKDPSLRHLFPGKTLRCATEEFAAFLIQFLNGPESQSQKRWWLSLRESHARFKITAADRTAWLSHMNVAIEETIQAPTARQALHQFFNQTSAYIRNHETPTIEHPELKSHWANQQTLDHLIAAINTNDDDTAISLAHRFTNRPSILTGILARMMQANRSTLSTFVLDSIATHPHLVHHRFAGRALLHFAAAAGSLEAVTALLQITNDPNVEDHGRHTPLYAVANECATETGPDIVRLLIHSGANPNIPQGQSAATPLHMAARRGHLEIARTLLDLGANPHHKDKKGDTPLQRARNCRQRAVERLLLERLPHSALPF